MIKRLLIAFSLIVGTLTPVSLVYAEPFSIVPVVNPRVVADFPLNETFLAKMEAIQQQRLSLPAETDNPQYGNDTSIGGIIAIIQDKPKLMGLLSRNGMSPHDYVVGGMALGAALSAAASDGEDQIFDETLTVSKTNLEFGKKYADRIRTLLGED